MVSGKVGLTITGLVLTAIVLSFGYLSIAPRVSSTSATTAFRVPAAPLRKVENFGPQISLDQARADLRLEFMLPNALPNGFSIEEIRGVPNSVSIVYSSPTIPIVPNWNRGSMIIIVARDNTTYYPASGPVQGGSEVISCNTTNKSAPCTTTSYTLWAGQQSFVENVLVSGHNGLALNPNVSPKDATSFITWWVSGVHYSILANIPVSSLLSIAQSMNS